MRKIAIILLSPLFLVLSLAAACSQTEPDTDWHITFQSTGYGPPEAVFSFSETDTGYDVQRYSDATDMISKLPKAKGDSSDPLFSFALKKVGNNYEGALAGEQGQILFEPTDNGFRGNIDGLCLAGPAT